MRKDTGGQVYSNVYEKINNWGSKSIMVESGMTMRQYYKCQILKGSISKYGTFGVSAKVIADRCGEYADALIKEDMDSAK